MLGETVRERCKRYKALFTQSFDTQLLDQIRRETNKGLVVGNDRFREEIKKLTGTRAREKKRERPIGWRKRKPNK